MFDVCETRIDLMRVLDTLSPRHLTVIKLRFFEGRTLQETGSHFGVRLERARQYEAKALRLLRKQCKRFGLRLCDF
jgi:RNA polymerase sigma factor (sigma-70 family)